VPQPMGSVAEGQNPHTCSACQTACEPTHDSDDGLCPGCRNVFRAAVVLLRSGIVSEEELIPTLVFARIAGRAEDQHYKHHNSSVYEPAEESLMSGTHPALEVTKFIDRVPVVRVKPIAVSAERHEGTQILKRVRIRTLSKKVKSYDVADSYRRLLEQEGVPWDENNHGEFAYDCLFGYLELEVAQGAEFSPLLVEGYGGDPLRHPAFHFPPPEIVEGVHEAMKRTFANRLDYYGKAQRKTPGKLVPAFAAWHVGAQADTEIPPAARPRVSSALNRHLLRPCGLRQVTVSSRNPDDLVWRDAADLWPRFVRIQHYAFYPSHRRS
jgi:hypothetical protein